jgi:hypothetical protein
VRRLQTRALCFVTLLSRRAYRNSGNSRDKSADLADAHYRHADADEPRPRDRPQEESENP